MATFAVLTRIEPEAHMDRWYLCAVTQTLLDPIAVLCAWGSRHTAYQQMQVFPMTSHEVARQRVEKIVAQKVRRGYQVVVSDMVDVSLERK